ncbi:hypothetical protein Tco_1158591 [Tanacetum coccineum]
MLYKLKPYYDEQNKVAIGYKNPLCLTRAQQVQPALYNSHEIIKTNHVPTIVHNSEDTLEIAEITKKKMNDKMKDPECVKKKVKIEPHDYSKENYLATFTPQKQLAPEQIFWSNDLIKMKAEALKEQTTTLRPIKALTVYPLNTPTTLVPRVLPTLVPRVLPTKSQVKINIFALIQLFLEFEKTCKKRIRPTELTEWERGFEQTKECYLTEVIPFFKTLKNHFEGIQKALTKEIKEMKDIFEELEAEVDQNIVHRKHDEIERKTLLIANDNLIADCLSKDVFYIATNSKLNISRFTEMHDAHTVVQAHCLELEAKLSNLRDKLKYQNLKESFRNNTSPPARDVPDFDSVFVIGKMKASIQGKDNAIKKLRMQISQLKETCSDADRTLDFRALEFQITLLTEQVTVLQEQNELFRDENAKLKQHYNELHDSIKITRAKHIEQTTALLTENENLKAQLHENLKCITIDSIKPRVLAPGVNSCTNASGLQPRSNTKNNRISPAKSVNKKKLKEHTRTNKSSLKTTNRVDSSISSKRTQVWKPKQVKQVWKATRKVLTNVGYHWRPTGRIFTLGEQCPLTRFTKPKVVPVKQTENVSTSKSVITKKVVQIVLWYLDSGCSKHMTGDRSRLRNFVKKFTRTVRFRNDHFGAIMGYEDYVIGDSVIFRVYYVEGLGHNLFSVRQFCDSNLEVAFRKHSCYVRDTDGVELIKGSRGFNLYTISVEDMMKSSPILLVAQSLQDQIMVMTSSFKPLKL